MGMIYAVVLIILGWSASIGSMLLNSESLILAATVFFVGGMICHSIYEASHE